MFNVLAKEITRGDVHPDLPGSHQFHLGGWGKGAMSIEEAMVLHSLVMICKPRNVLETGTEQGWSAAVMAHACRENGFGKVTTLELHGEQAANARLNLDSAGITQQWCDIVVDDSMDFIRRSPDVWDFVLLDTAIGMRGMELEAILPKLSTGAIVTIHDTSPLHPMHGGYMILEDIKRFGLQTINLPSPRGLTILQRSIP